MPMLIDFIDKIARSKCRDVLFVTFQPPASLAPRGWNSEPFIDWEHLPVREQIIAWLDEQNIAWQPCGYVANENRMFSYDGQIYIDVPFDTASPIYRKLADYLETPDGRARLNGAWFCCLPLASAMKNAHQDEPGYWEKWGERF